MLMDYVQLEMEKKVSTAFHVCNPPSWLLLPTLAPSLSTYFIAVSFSISGEDCGGERALAGGRSVLVRQCT